MTCDRIDLKICLDCGMVRWTALGDPELTEALIGAEIIKKAHE